MRTLPTYTAQQALEDAGMPPELRGMEIHRWLKAHLKPAEPAPAGPVEAPKPQAAARATQILTLLIGEDLPTPETARERMGEDFPSLAYGHLCELHRWIHAAPPRSPEREADPFKMMLEG